jgi:hypothetical protein
MTALELIAEERHRQIAKGYDAAHDDAHANGEIADAAGMILFEHTQGPGCIADDDEPDDWMQALALKLRHADPQHRLVVAGALIAAEIERLQRAHAQSVEGR